jgi:hypothetical protein
MSRDRPRAIYTSSRRRGPGPELVWLIVLCLLAGAIVVIGGTWMLDGV